MDLITFSFKLTNVLKLYHWNTTSYARHIASGTLFDTLILLLDKLVETYQGKYDRISVSTIELSISKLSDSDIVSLLRESITYLSHIEDYTKIKKGDTDILNIRDEIIGEINKTLYLFTFN
jgi:hypothetical protein